VKEREKNGNIRSNQSLGRLLSSLPPSGADFLVAVLYPLSHFLSPSVGTGPARMGQDETLTIKT
jgi:hypothetical protein